MSVPPRLGPSALAAAFAAVVLVLAGVIAATALTGSATTPAAPPASVNTATSSAAAVTGCRYRSRMSSVRSGPAARRRIALTFDDGPSSFTARILDVLEAAHVPATFFVVGKNVEGHEALLTRMLDAGHMIGNHSFDHVSLAKADAAALRQIDDTQAAIEGATGFTPCLLRPPFGLGSRKLLRALAGRHLTSTLWSVNPQDFRTPGTATIKRRVLAGVKPGAIILDHDGGGDRSQTLAAIPSIIRTLKARGYRFVTVTDLLGLGVKR
jgi:peptidoglycan/xylan/chitin deacetylase (PgdA/CDA1 family)